MALNTTSLAKKFKKKEAIHRDPFGRMVHVDEELLPRRDRKFIEDVRELTDRYSLLDLVAIEKNERVGFLEKLKYTLHQEEQDREEKAAQEIEEERKQREKNEREQHDKHAAEMAQLEKALADKSRSTSPVTENEVQVPKLEQKTEPDTGGQPIADARTQVSKSESESIPEERKLTTQEKQSVALIHDPSARKEKIKTNLKVILDWLRQEPYSTVEVMSLVLRMSKPGTRKVLNKFVKEGWLVRDEVRWIGSSKPVHLFGVSSKGLYHLLDEDDVEPGPNRDFKRGKVAASNGDHVLNIQLTRLYFQRIQNPNNHFRRYTAARDMPFCGDKNKKWDKYPDATVDFSHLEWANRPGKKLKLAIEVEQYGKGSKRYRDIVKAHLKNINQRSEDPDLSDRYDLVIYFLPDMDIANNLQRLFEKHIEYRMFILDTEIERAKSCFRYESYADLPERIRELG